MSFAEGLPKDVRREVCVRENYIRLEFPELRRVRFVEVRAEEPAITVEAEGSADMVATALVTAFSAWVEDPRVVMGLAATVLRSWLAVRAGWLV